jgi:Virulence factor BrkB
MGKRVIEDILEVFWQAIVVGVVEIFKNHPKDQLATKVPISDSYINSSVGIWTATATLLQNAFIHALVPKLDQHVTVDQVEKTRIKSEGTTPEIQKNLSFAERYGSCLPQRRPSQGAALSYYTIFAIAPLFIIALAIAGFWFGEEAARRELFGQVDQLIGKQGGDAIQSLVAAANKSKGGLWATCIACVTLAVAATGVFVQLQNSLNKIWSVPQAQGKGLRNFIRHRLLSFAMVFGIGFLLWVSLVCSAALAALGNFIGNYLSGTDLLLKALNFSFHWESSPRCSP